MDNYNHKQFVDWLNGEMQKVNEQDNKLLVEAKLSKYWKARAKRRALKAERQWPNTVDRDWAIQEQEKSSKMNSVIHALFEKELEESEEMLGEIDHVMKAIKKGRNAIKMKREAKKQTLDHPADATAKRAKGKSLSKPYPKHKKGETVGGYYRKASKKLGGIGLAPGESFGPAAGAAGAGGGGAAMEEQKEKGNENN